MLYERAGGVDSRTTGIRYKERRSSSTAAQETSNKKGRRYKERSSSSSTAVQETSTKKGRR